MYIRFLFSLNGLTSEKQELDLNQREEAFHTTSNLDCTPDFITHGSLTTETASYISIVSHDTPI